MALFPVNCDELQKIVLKLKPNSNFNNILPISHMKQCLDILTEPITKLINESFNNGIFPDVLKIARVVPIYKGSGDSLSLLPTTGP